MNIGLFGGTFDPFIERIALAQAAQENLSSDVCCSFRRIFLPKNKSSL